MSGGYQVYIFVANRYWRGLDGWFWSNWMLQQ